MPALRFVAGDGVGKFYLQRIHVRIFHDQFVAFAFVLFVEIVFFEFKKKCFHCFSGHRRFFNRQCIHPQDCFKIAHFFVVDELHTCAGKLKSEACFTTQNPIDFHNFTVRNKSCIGLIGQPIIIVFHNHQQISATQLVFKPQNPIPNLLVILIRAFV